jgi:PKD repeat protein
VVSNAALQANVLGKATRLGTVLTDYDGQSRQSPTDIGADQYQNAPSSLTVSPATIPAAVVNTFYTATLSATGGSGTYIFAVSSGNLPSWLTLNAKTGQLSGTPTAAGTSTFTVTVSDLHASGLTGSQQFTLTVNPPLVVSAGSDVTTQVGKALPFAGTATGGIAPLTYAWDFGDGGKASGSLTPTYTYANSGTYTVTLTVTDAQNHVGQGTLHVTVQDVAPTVAILGAPMSSPEGTAISLTSTVTSPSPADMSAGFSYAWSVTANGSAFASATTPNFSFTPLVHGTYVVTLAVTDQFQLTGTASQTITATAVAPLVSINGAPASGTPGTAIALTSSVVSPSSADPVSGFTYAWSVTQNNASVASGTNPNFSFTPSTAGTYVVTLAVTDQESATGRASTSISVSSTLTVSAGGPYTAVAGSVVHATAVVTDTNPAEAAAGFTYAWTWGDGPASPTPGNPCAHTYGAVGTFTVTVTVTAQDGQSCTATSTATIAAANQGGPTANAGGPYTGVPGTAIAFTGSATDSNPSNSGFAYAWNFGDNGTSNVASPSHTYAAAGTYNVTFTVTDSSGKSDTDMTTTTVTAAPPPPPPPSGNFITTAYDKIPNFGANANIVSTGSGPWSSPSTWSLGRVPQAGDVVSIDPNTTVTYDTVSSAAINTVVIRAGGSLLFRTDISTTLTVVNLLVLQGGTLQIGTASNPVAANVKAQIVFVDQPLNTSVDPAQYGNGLIGLGTVTMYGAAMPSTFINLATEPKAGDTTLTLAQPATGWQVGDRIILPDTRQLVESERFANFTPQYEMLQIQGISPDGTVLTLSSALQYNHLGARDGNGVLDFLPQVADLSRNVVIHSANPAGTRGYVMFTDRANVDVRYVQFSGLGRTTDATPDNTTFDAHGNVTHFGTNETDRNPIIFRHLMGPSTTPSNGYQFTFVGNSDFCPMVPMDEIWGLTINDANYGLISNNIVYHWAGAGIAIENNAGSFNLFQSNFVVGIQGSASPRANTGLYGAGFWLTSFNNYLVNNIAADCTGTFQGIVAGSGFDLNTLPAQTQNTPVPLFPGADLQVPGQYKLVNMQLLPILQFSGNQAYGAIAVGLTIWNLGTNGYGNEVGTTAMGTIKDFVAWHCHDEGFFSYNIQNLTFDGFVVRGDARDLPNPSDWGQAWAASDYWSENVTIQNADIQGMAKGIAYDSETPGTFTIQNSYFRNYSTDISVQSISVPGTHAPTVARKTVINNVKFDAWAGQPLMAISMDYNGGASNLVQLDQVLVYNYNQVAGNNFQVYYTQQAASYVVPQTVTDPTNANNVWILGSPQAGLTNQQTWAQFGIAIAGAVAPANTTTRSEINGLIGPITSG